MGLFTFVKEAGQKLGMFEDKEQEAESRARLEEAVEKRRARALVRMVQASGLVVEGLAVTVDADRATVSGRARSQADREKVVLMVGNTEGIAAVDDRITIAAVQAATAAGGPAPAPGAFVGPPAPEKAATFYTVQAGDSLSAIAKKHYGDARKYPVIFEANVPMLKDPDKIYPGQVLRIPPRQ